MKLILKRLAPAMLVVLILVTPAIAQQIKIATVDLREVFNKYWKRQQAQSSLNEKGAMLDKQLKTMYDDYNTLEADYKKIVASASDQSVTPEEREKRKTAAETKLRDMKEMETSIRRFGEEARDNIDTQKKRMRDTILADIRAAVNAKAKSAGYTMVLDSAADSFNQTPVILYTNGENDITDVIISYLNVNAPPPGTNDTPKLDDASTSSGTLKGDKK